jgi:hypothetical protein
MATDNNSSLQMAAMRLSHSVVDMLWKYENVRGMKDKYGRTGVYVCLI